MDNENDIIEKFKEELSKVNLDEISNFDGRVCTFNVSSNPSLQTSIEAVFNEIESLPGDTISFSLTKCKFQDVLFYYNETHFINRYNLGLEGYREKKMVFLNPVGDRGENQVTYEEIDLFVVNVINYKLLRNLFIVTKDLTQFDNESSKTFAIVSKEYGVFHVGYILPKFSYFYTINIEGKFERLRNEFLKKEFIQFFKEIIVTSVHSTDEKDRFKVIIRQLDSIIDLTLKDYEAYVSNFAIDKIKSDFKKERVSYFESIDNSISSIGKQVVAFPLTFAASIFASYKVQDKLGILLLILLAYFLYTIVAFMILTMTCYNVRCLRKDVYSEEEAIKNGFNIIHTDFKPDFDKIKNKIYLLRITVAILYVVLFLLFVLFVLFAINTIEWIDLTYLVTWLAGKK